MQEEYVQGFMAKCAAAGIDSEELLKQSRELTESSDQANAIGGRIGGLYGGVTGASASIAPAILAALAKRPGLGAGIAVGGTALGALAGKSIGRGLVPNKYKNSKIEMLKQKFRDLVAKVS